MLFLAVEAVVEAEFCKTFKYPFLNFNCDICEFIAKSEKKNTRQGKITIATDVILIARMKVT